MRLLEKDMTPLQIGLVTILDSDEAMRALSARHHAIRLEGNFSAHDVQSFDRLQIQLANDENHPLDSESTEATRIFSQFFINLPERIPPVLFAEGMPTPPTR